VKGNAIVAAVEKQVTFSLADKKKGSSGNNYNGLDKNTKEYIMSLI